MNKLKKGCMVLLVDAAHAAFVVGRYLRKIDLGKRGTGYQVEALYVHDPLYRESWPEADFVPALSEADNPRRLYATADQLVRIAGSLKLAKARNQACLHLDIQLVNALAEACQP